MSDRVNLRNHFDHVIDDHLSKLDELEPGTDDARTTVDELSILADAAESVQSSRKNWKDYVMPIVGTLVPILVILNYEKFDAITSKSFSMIPKTHF